MAKKVMMVDNNQEEDEPTVKQINSSTQIIFTMKTFFGFIGSILILFFGFYQLVIVPKVNTTETHYSVIFNDQKEQNRLFYVELGKINTSIGSLNSSIETLNKINTNQTSSTNSGGSLGGNSRR